MTDHTNAEQIAEARDFVQLGSGINIVEADRLIEELSRELEAAEQRVKRAEVELANQVSVISEQRDKARDERDAAYAVIEKVRGTAAEHWGYQTRREAKFGREGSSCVCGVCAIMRALSTAPAQGARNYG